MKKKIGILLSFICLVIIGAVAVKMTTSANTANISISATAPTVEKEQEFELKISVASDVSMESLDTLVSYNPEVIEFVSCDDDAVAGASGMLHILDTFETGSSSVTYTLKFKALEVGSTELTLSDTVVEEYKTKNFIEPSASPAAIEVITNQKVSSESRLSDLLVVPQLLDETFNPDVYDYHMTVGVDTEKLILSAVPMDEQAVVAVEMPETLSIGENTAVIRVTALSGDEAVYTIHVKRLSEALPDEPETADETGETEPLSEPETGEAMDSSADETADTPAGESMPESVEIEPETAETIDGLNR